jgi:hypothetical protein
MLACTLDHLDQRPSSSNTVFWSLGCTLMIHRKWPSMLPSRGHRMWCQAAKLGDKIDGCRSFQLTCWSWSWSIHTAVNSRTLWILEMRSVEAIRRWTSDHSIISAYSAWFPFKVHFPIKYRPWPSSKASISSPLTFVIMMPLKKHYRLEFPMGRVLRMSYRMFTPLSCSGVRSPTDTLSRDDLSWMGAVQIHESMQLQCKLS